MPPSLTRSSWCNHRLVSDMHPWAAKEVGLHFCLAFVLSFALKAVSRRGTELAVPGMTQEAFWALTGTDRLSRNDGLLSDRNIENVYLPSLFTGKQQTKLFASTLVSPTAECFLYPMLRMDIWEKTRFPTGAILKSCSSTMIRLRGTVGVKAPKLHPKSLNHMLQFRSGMSPKGWWVKGWSLVCSTVGRLGAYWGSSEVAGGQVLGGDTGDPNTFLFFFPPRPWMSGASCRDMLFCHQPSCSWTRISPSVGQHKPFLWISWFPSVISYSDGKPTHLSYIT